MPPPHTNHLTSSHPHPPWAVPRGQVTAGPMTYDAEENWKSLRTMSMNEVVYIDDDLAIMRNCGALRIFFVYERV